MLLHFQSSWTQITVTQKPLLVSTETWKHSPSVSNQDILNELAIFFFRIYLFTSFLGHEMVRGRDKNMRNESVKGLNLKRSHC